MALAKATSFAPLVNLDTLCVLFHSEKKRLLVLSGREQGFAPRKQSHNLRHGKGAVNNGVDVETGVHIRRIRLNATIRLVI